MTIGFIGSGSMAGALARGLAVQRPLFTSGDGRRARALAEELGGEAIESNERLCELADVVVLGFKPKALGEVAAQLAGARTVISLLAATDLATLERSLPDRPVYRLMTSIPAEIKAGPICLAAGSHADGQTTDRVRELLARAGSVIDVDEREIDPAVGLMGSGPAFYALIADAFAEAGVAHGLERERARELVARALGASVAYIEASGYDPAPLRDRVATPGGLTEQGLELLDRRGVPAAIAETVDLLVEASRG